MRVIVAIYRPSHSGQPFAHLPIAHLERVDTYLLLSRRVWW
jgi:hypothetical protein